MNRAGSPAGSSVVIDQAGYTIISPVTKRARHNSENCEVDSEEAYKGYEEEEEEVEMENDNGNGESKPDGTKSKPNNDDKAGKAEEPDVKKKRSRNTDENAILRFKLYTQALDFSAQTLDIIEEAVSKELSLVDSLVDDVEMEKESEL